MPRLTYFDFDGSRGLECRLALVVAGVEFEDVRVNRPQWAALKPVVPFGALPVFEDGELTLAQTNAILQYIGRTHGLHPSDHTTSAQHEDILQSVEDLRHKVPGRDVPKDELPERRRAFAEGFLTQWATTVDGRIQGPFVEGDTLHIVDLKLYVILRSYFSGIYDHIPADQLAPYPRLVGLYDAVGAHPAVRGWLQP